MAVDFLLFLWLLWTLLASILVGYVAHTKGRTEIGWFFAAAFLTPFFAALCLIALPQLREETPS